MNQRIGRRTNCAGQRGVTLIEVMIVVVIMGLIAGGVAVAVLPKYMQAKITTTRTNAKVVRGAAAAWRMDRALEACPTVDLLVADRALDQSSPRADAFGTPFKIVCNDEDTVVISLGPDKRESEDDIVEPAPVAMQRP